MAALSDAAEVLILNYLMTAESVTRPTAWYVALYTGAPSDAGGGTEVSGSGYSRKTVNWAVASGTGGTTSNSNVPTWTASGGAFGTVTHIGIHSASSGSGNLLWHGAMTASKVVNDGDTLEFAAGNIDLTIA